MGCGKHSGAQEAAGFAETLAATRDVLPEPLGFEEGGRPARRGALGATRAARAPQVPRSRPAAAGCGRAARHARATGGSPRAVASAAAAASLVCPLEASLSEARSHAADPAARRAASRSGTGALQEGSGVTRRGFGGSRSFLRTAMLPASHHPDRHPPLVRLAKRGFSERRSKPPEGAFLREQDPNRASFFAGSRWA